MRACSSGFCYPFPDIAVNFARARVLCRRMGPDWPLRKIPEELVRRYYRERLWTEETLPDLGLVVVAGETPPPEGTIGFDALLEGERLDRPKLIDPDAPSVVGYTSGTTANAKGVVHSHRTLVAELHQIVEMGATAARPMLVGAPVGHAIGMQAGLLNPLLRGLSIHLTDV